MMILTIRLFAIARELAGAPEIKVQLTESARVTDLKRAIGEHYPQLRPILERTMIAVNNDYAEEDQLLDDQDEVALIPPVSGG